MQNIHCVPMSVSQGKTLPRKCEACRFDKNFVCCMVHVDAKFWGEFRFLKILSKIACFSLFYNKTFP